MSHHPKDTQPQLEMKVLALGLPRSGTVSIADALTILGYKNVYHSLKSIDMDKKNDWHVFNRAADASFPVLSTYTGRAFTREEWDEVYGSCEAATDTAAMFSPHILQAYPDAKVILVKRDFGRWFKSIDEMVLTGLWSPLSGIFVHFVHPVLGLSTITAMRKALLGLFEAKDVAEIRRNAQTTYDRHHRQIQEMVPPEQLLVYKLGDGWEPLCEFLGKPVPDGEFPWVNEASELKRVTRKILRSQLVATWYVLMPWVLAAGVLAVASWGIKSGVLGWS
ncbi:hypothetical protein PT974_07987 [Cladobotryum mycophilum]|uniref:NAD dependent epimerase/dehydratase n=1 Tax=Cladobotryum mycophilum TaxID=491253 RepID=A0ABR0SCA2_9HYPO